MGVSSYANAGFTPSYEGNKEKKISSFLRDFLKIQVTTTVVLWTVN